jgi:Tol biopolymer transport system component
LDGRRPTWSPDGAKLAVSLSESALVIGSDGTLLAPGGGAYATWSPHGVYVTYTSGGLWIENLTTLARRRLTQHMNEKPSWSPDGKIIAGGTSGKVELVRAKDGKRLQLFPASSIGAGVPSWSPTSVVTFTHANACGIDIARENGSGLRRLTRVC